MSNIFLKQLHFPNIDYNLDLGKHKNINQVGKMIIEISNIFKKVSPDWVFVFGDVNSSLAASIAAKKLIINLAHVESGLRCNDFSMQEEINRVIIDRIADVCFTTERSANINLKKEGIEQDKIIFVGNTMIDPIMKYNKNINDSLILKKYNLKPKNYIVLTIHRPINLIKKKFLKIVKKIEFWNQNTKIIMPLHPRNRNKLDQISSNWELTPPFSYYDFIHLIKHSKGVFTDSGGVQEETSFLNVPCFTIRNNTERPITILNGTNNLITDQLLQNDSVWKNKNKKKKNLELWDGKSGKRIYDFFKKFVKKQKIK